MSEMGQDLIKSIQQIHDHIVHGKKPKGSKIYIADEISTKHIRKKLGMSQREFAEHYDFNLRTLQDWEQGRRVPLSSQQILLKIIDNEHDVVERFLPHHNTSNKPIFA